MTTTTTTTYTYDSGVLVETVAVTVTGTASEPPAGGLLAVKAWMPTTDTQIACNNYLDYDAVRIDDLWIEAVVPASGRVLVSLSAQTGQGVASKYEFWGLMIGAAVVAKGRVGYSTIFHRVTARFLVDGLTPGETVKLDWAHKTEQGGTSNLYVGPEWGPAVMEVWAA